MNTMNEVTVDCPRCKSSVGYKCMTPSGASKRQPHQERIQAYKANAGAFKDGTRDIGVAGLARLMARNLAKSESEAH